MILISIVKCPANPSKMHETAGPCAHTKIEIEEKLRKLNQECPNQSLKRVRHQSQNIKKQNNFSSSEVEVPQQEQNIKGAVIFNN